MKEGRMKAKGCTAGILVFPSGGTGSESSSVTCLIGGYVTVVKRLPKQGNVVFPASKLNTVGYKD